ncbi:MAG: PrsW family intramembrane metalloprotease, partial [Candidatus Liptonbacteria bacterium]|nr:PrsW family intramembrane metalloprotease [Candidatus Liptonbacteria bacterium]
MSILIVFLALVPSFAWLFFYLQEDLHPEPKKLLALTFVVGAAFSVPALYLQIASNCVLLLDCEAARQDFAAFSVPFIFLFAFIEEAAKFAAAYFTVRRSPAFNEPVDAMIYMVVASLGFAAAENLGIFNFGRAPGVPFADAFEITTLRFIGATLLHALASAIVGYYWAVSIRDFGMR